MHYDPNGDSFSLLLVGAIAAFAYTCLVAILLDGMTEEVSIAAEFKIGYGLKLSAGEKTGVSFANGIGGSIEIEWED